MPVAPPREHPLWLRIPLNLSGPFGVAVALFGFLNIAVGMMVAAIGAVYVAWEIDPSAHGFVRKRPVMVFPVFLICGLALDL